MEPQNKQTNVLTSDVELKGTLRFTDALTFDGKLEGDITSDGSLTFGENAVVKGDIRVGSVVVRGKINGNVTAREKIDIKARTELFGDIRSPKLVIEEGATLVGQTQVGPVGAGGQPGKAPEPGKPRP